MDGELDVYVWSVEDRHFVRAEYVGVRVTFACFTNAQVARNFRAWLVGIEGIARLCIAISRTTDFIHDNDLHDMLNVIAERRKHPAQLWTDKDFRFRRLEIERI